MLSLVPKLKKVFKQMFDKTPYPHPQKCCESCGKDILLIKNIYSGKKLPADPMPTQFITEMGKVVMGYLPHWTHCDFKKPENYNRNYI